MLDNTISITHNAVSVTLTRVNQDNYSSKYFGELANGDKVTLSVAHTIPSRGAAGESHLVRLDIEHYDAEGVYQRTSSAWTVVKTFDGIQDSVECGYAADALVGLTTSAFLAKVLGRES